MGKKLEKFAKDIARDVASPIIKRLLRGFTGEEVAQAVEDDANLVEELRRDRGWMMKLRIVISGIPFSGRAAPYICDKKWLRWFLENEMKDDPELREQYLQFAYNPAAFPWLHRNIKDLTDYLF